MSNTPPNDQWWQSSEGEPPPPGGYPPPQPGGYPPPPSGGYPPPSPGYPPPSGGYQQPGSWGGGYPPQGGGYGNYPPPPPVDPRYQYGQPSTGYVLAGWWLRVGATVIDFLVLLIPNGILRAVGGAYAGPFLSLILGAAYITFMLSSRGQTVGNMAVGTRVVDSQTGGPIGAGKAFARWASEFVLFLLFVIPGILDILWPLWDRENQTLHDKMAGTVVLKNA